MLKLNDIINDGDLSIRKYSAREYDLWLYQGPDINPYVMIFHKEYSISLSADLYHPRVQDNIHTEDLEFLKEFVRG